MSETMKIPVSEMKLAKYETFIGDIETKIGWYGNWYSFSGQGIVEGKNTALALIYDYETCNEYAKIIMDKSIVYIYESDYSWRDKYPTYDSFGSIKGKIGAAKEFVQFCRRLDQYTVEGYKFIFWALMVLTVEQSDAEKHLSLICDLANMLDITDDEFEDIIQVVKTVCNGSVSEYKFKSKVVSRLFDGVLSQYAS